MPRAFLIVMDSVGIGGAPDAEQFFNDGVPDTGANTVGHIADQIELELPTLDALGLGAAAELASGIRPRGLGAEPTGAWGAATEVSLGKDTPSGHWELAGVPVPWDWHTFPNVEPSFPDEISALICEYAGTEGLLGNRHASGTQVLVDEGEQHLKTGWPICYTSVDSVLQIAAHEEAFGLERLLKLCADVAPKLHSMRVGRVIARPFLGETAESFVRTENRKDFAIAPPGDTLCDLAQAAGCDVYAVGKIGDIFSMRGIKEVRKGRDAQLMAHLSDLVDEALDNTLVFANFVEFDSEYGHRRDVQGYARHMRWFDVELSKILPRLGPDDLLIVTADHGNDPTWVGTDHTRERVPVLVHGLGAKRLGHLQFSDVGASVAAHLNVPYSGAGRSFL